MTRSADRTIIMLTDKMSKKSGGRTISMFRRAKLFTSMGCKVYIATMDDKSNYQDIFAFLCEKMDCKGLGFLNPYAYYNEEEIRSFSDEDDMIEHWIAAIDRKYGKPVFFIESHLNQEQVLDNRYADQKLKTVAMIHSNIFDKPYVKGSPQRAYYKKVLDRWSDYNAVVTLTNQCAEDIRGIYPGCDNLYAIPHPLPRPLLKRLSAKRQRHLIVVCSRYTRIKRLLHIIKAFRLVVDQVPDAKLVFYGEGEKREAMEDLVRSLDLQKSVTIDKFVSDPLKAFGTAEVTVITSMYEGLAMTINEALFMGTPVVSYDFLYGPGEYIVNGENGYIVENGNKEALAQAVIRIFKDPDLSKRLSKNAYHSKNVPSDDELKDLWGKLFSDVFN